MVAAILLMVALLAALIVGGQSLTLVLVMLAVLM